MNPLISPPLAAGIMELNPGLTLWVAITFLVLIVVLAKVAWRPIVKMLDERERTIRDAIDQAKRERAEAEKLLAQQKESLAQARREAADLAKRNQQEVEGLRAELTAKARKEADDLVTTARRTIEEETRKAAAELKAQVADLAVGAATRIVKSSLDEKAQRALVEEYLRELPAGRN
ncbi:MAG TPA: F0F1 ATP synthase subunit B [Anaeromyxobacteraceae bacterium]|nr:F0F1 ATP synthase subunit B [Anaeromyxobacteraceae bacterium]